MTAACRSPAVAVGVRGADGALTGAIPAAHTGPAGTLTAAAGSASTRPHATNPTTS